MSPDDISQVNRTWSLALTDLDALLEAVADRLPGSVTFRTQRAQWIVRAVTCLSPVLDHPTAFVPAAINLISVRFPVTTEELASERDALLGALDERCGPLTPETVQAWNLAIELFGEIVCSIGMDPFDAFPDAVEPSHAPQAVP